MDKNRKIEFPTISTFFDENKRNILICTIFILIVYGLKLFNVTYSIDTEAIMSVPDNLYGSWLQLGRFGAIAIKWLLGTSWFNPYFASIMSVFALIVCSSTWMYVISCFLPSSSKSFKILWVFPSVFLTAPIMAEQTSFLLQSYEVIFCMILISFTQLCLWKGIILKLNKHLVFSGIFAFFCFATYQAMVPFFIASTIFIFILIYDNHELNFAFISDKKFLWKAIGKVIGVFLISLMSYFVFNKIILDFLNLGTSSYISDQVLWGNASIEDCISNIFRHIYNVMLGHKTFRMLVLLPLYIISFIYILFRIHKKEKQYYLFFLAFCTFLISPFLLTIALGQNLAYRTEINVPFVAAALFFYFLNVVYNTKNYVKNKTLIQYSVYVIVFAVLVGQIQTSTRLYYTEYVKFQEDLMLATKVSYKIEQIENVDLNETPVVFVGFRTPNRNKSTFETADLELLGRSFFEVSFSSMHGTWIMNNYFNTIGISYLLPSEEQVQVAEQLATDMDNWPSTNSVLYSNGVIVVRFS